MPLQVTTVTKLSLRMDKGYHHYGCMPAISNLLPLRTRICFYLSVNQFAYNNRAQ